MINVVLVEPEIPQNAGNIVRTTAACGVNLYMVEPLGFSMESKYYKRAGLDYHDLAHVEVVPDFDKFYEAHKDVPFFFASTKAPQSYTDVRYPKDCYIVFGKESFGLRESLLKKHYDSCIKIPMKEGTRSLNLANSVAIILYEAERQNDFAGLQSTGKLTGRID